MFLFFQDKLCHIDILKDGSTSLWMACSVQTVQETVSITALKVGYSKVCLCWIPAMCKVNVMQAHCLSILNELKCYGFEVEGCYMYM